jgi:hypothetical protein
MTAVPAPDEFQRVLRNRKRRTVADPRSGMRWRLATGVALSLILMLTIFGWVAVAQLAGAVIASGVVVIDNNIRSELSDIEARRQDCQLAIVQVQGRLAQAEQARDRVQLENAANLAKTIAATDSAIADAQQSLTANEIVGSIWSESNARIAWTTSSVRPRYEIVHRRPGNSPVTVAEETSSLRPGDILKISIQPSDLRDAGRASHPQIGFKENK